MIGNIIGIVIGIATIGLGAKAFKPEGIPLSKKKNIKGVPAIIIGVFCIILGVGFMLLSLIALLMSRR